MATSGCMDAFMGSDLPLLRGILAFLQRLSIAKQNCWNRAIGGRSRMGSRTDPYFKLAVRRAGKNTDAMPPE